MSLSSAELPLAEQLERNHGCGFEIHTWSYLPHGSGMGTSSILAGVVCAAIWTITSRNYNKQELLHLVVEVEQMLTTGGGWQDQVGGLLPGVKLTTSPATQPIQVQPELLDVSEDTLEKVKTNMALIYTGKTRLAKNLLQVLPQNVYTLKQARQCVRWIFIFITILQWLSQLDNLVMLIFSHSKAIKTTNF